MKSGKFKAKYIVRAYWPDNDPDKPGALAIEAACEDEAERDRTVAEFSAILHIGRIEVVPRRRPVKQKSSPQ